MLRAERNRLAFPLLVVGIWTAFGIFFGTQNYVRDAYAGKAASLPGYVVGWLLCGYSWGLLTVPVLKHTRRFSLPALGWSRFFLVHIPSAVIFASVQLGLYTLIATGLALVSGAPGRPLTEFYTTLFVREFQSSFLVYFAIISGVTAYDRILAPERPKDEAVESAVVIEELKPSNGNGAAAAKTYLKRIPVKDSGRILLVDADDVDWVESYGNYLFLHAGDKRHIFRETMAAMEGKLDPGDFVRIRRSALVRADRIQEMRSTTNGEYEIVLKTGTRLASTRRYRKNIESVLRP